MTGAMYAAISGLKAHMSKLNVIGNNVANVNTHGYKSQRVIFQDALYTTSRSGSNGSTTVGGRNPAQIGYGSVIGTIDLDMSTGNYAPGKPLDCMIDGDGFFLVGDKETYKAIDPSDPTSLASLTLTRVGNFDIDAQGYLVDGAGNVVYGFLATEKVVDGKHVICDQLVPIRLPRMETETKTTGTGADAVTVYAGDPIYPKIDTTDTSDTRGHLIDGDTDPNTPYLSFDSLTIDENTGSITVITKDSDTPVVVGYIALGAVTNPNGVTHQGGPYYKALGGAGDLSIMLMGGAAKEIGINYVNGSLTNENGDNYDPNAADADAADVSNKMRITGAGTTKLITGGLETSKADLATEISEMITTQRGYQANTRIITVTDSMLEELVNMKR